MQWDVERVVSVVNARASEGQSLEFKAQLPTGNDKGKAEFLKDVSAFANASGGAILFGVSEVAGSADSLSGLQISDADAEIRRLSQILESGLEPRIAGIQFEAIALGESSVLVVDVPQSFDAPHRYHFNAHSKFVQRNGTHVSELSFDQLRAAFDRSSARLDRLRADWDDDFSLKHLWRPVIEGPVCVLRLAPLLSADQRQVLDPKRAYDHWADLIFSSWGGGSSAFNYQGLVVFPGREESLPAMVQVHRFGAITAYRTGRITIDNRTLIPSVTVASFFIEAAKKLLKFARESGLAGSAILNSGLTRLSGYQFATSDRYGFETAIDSHLPSISLPTAWIEDLSDESTQLEQLLRPALDVLWQSYGKSECPYFDEAGSWNPPR